MEVALPFQNARLDQLIQLITTKTEQYGSFLVDSIPCKNKVISGS